MKLFYILFTLLAMMLSFYQMILDLLGDLFELVYHLVSFHGWNLDYVVVDGLTSVFLHILDLFWEFLAKETLILILPEQVPILVFHPKRKGRFRPSRESMFSHRSRILISHSNFLIILNNSIHPRTLINPPNFLKLILN